MALKIEDEVIEITSSSDEEVPHEIELSSTDVNALLEKFIRVCKPLLKTNQQNAITKLLKDKFLQARKEYTQSEKFRNLLEQHITDLQTQKKSVYVHIQDVKTLLMKASDNCRPKTVKEENVSDDEPKNDAQSDEVTDEKEKCRRGEEGGGSADLLMTCETISSGNFIEDLRTDDVKPKIEEEHDSDLARGNLDQVAGPSTSLNTPVNKTLDDRNGKTVKIEESNQKKKDQGKGSQRQVRKLEWMLKRICKAIKRLEERELTLDEMDEEDSVHIQEYQLRKRFMKVYNIYCKLNDCSPSTGRVIEQKIHYKGTRFPEINKRLERLINKKDFFPDFPDVYKAVYKTNLKKNLCLDRRRINSIAQEAFEDVGRKLQKRRHEDFILNFSAHSTLDFSSAKDPSDKDPELKRKLLENKKVASQKTKEVDEPFVKRQEEYEKNGIVLEAAEHSESDVASDVLSDEEDVSTLKRRKIDRSDWEEQKRNDNENKEGSKEAEGSPKQTMNSFITAPSNSDVQHQPNLADPLSQQQQQFQVHALDLGSSNGNLLSSRVPSFHNGVLGENIDPPNVSDIKPYKPAVDTPGNAWFTCYSGDEGASLQVGQTHSVKSPRLPIKPEVQPSSYKYNTAEQAVRALRRVPLLITNVCSLSPDYKHQHRPHKVAWTQGETIAVKDDGFVIGQQRRQKIITVQSGVQNVELKTSTPVTLSIDDSDSTELSSENPGRVAVLAKSFRESGSCSPTSTQPDLEMPLEPDIEEVKVASTRHALKWSTEQQLENTTTTDPPVRKVTISSYKTSTETAHGGQVVVSETSSTCNSVQCNHHTQMKRGVAENVCKQFCIQSTLVSNSGSYLQKTSAGSNLKTQIHPRPLKPQALFQVDSLNEVKTTPKPHETPKKQFVSLKIQTSPKLQGSVVPSTRLLTCPKPASNKNDKNSNDVIIISDSDSETGDMTELQPESSDVICILDSD